MRFFRVAMQTVAVGFWILSMILWINGVVYGDGAWSSRLSPDHPIPMQMHGSVVYLSPWQKFIYYDAQVYCLWAFVAFGLIAAVFHRLSYRRGNAPSSDGS